MALSNIWNSVIDVGVRRHSNRRLPTVPWEGGVVLPVKKSVRQARGLDVGDVASVTVELIDFA